MIGKGFFQFYSFFKIKKKTGKDLQRNRITGMNTIKDETQAIKNKLSMMIISVSHSMR